jgi:hypothetical protein
MPGQAAAVAGASDDLIAEDRMDIVDGIDLHCRAVLPRHPEACQPALHRVEDGTRLGLQPGRRDIPARHDVVWKPSALGPFAAAGDNEAP